MILGRMQLAINETFNNPKNNDLVKAYQKRALRKGKVPELDDFICYMAGLLLLKCSDF